MDKKIFFNRKECRTSEEKDILNSLNEIRESMGLVYQRLDYTADELITDSLNYELLALKTRHRYFIQKAKEKGIRECQRFLI